MHKHTFAGTVQSGGTGSVLPLRDVLVTLHEATAGAPNTIGSAQTGRDGKFSFHIPDASTDSIFYATARAGDGVVLVAIVGPEIRGEVVINELTTVAAAFSMAQFSDGARIAGNASGLRIAAG